MNPDFSQKIERILNAMMQGDDAVKLQANADAAELPFEAASMVAEVIKGDDRVRSKTAGEVLKMMTHHAARPGAKVEARNMTGELSKLVNNNSPKNLRLLVIDLLGYVGGAEAVPTLSKQLMDPDTQDVARMALERIPSRAAETALRTALSKSSPEFRNSLELSLLHRKMKFKTVGVKL
jgi:hypothetical protein